MTTFRERIIGLARSLKISREDFTVGPFIDWPAIQKRIEARFIVKTTSDLQPDDWPQHFKGKKQVIKSRTFEPFEYLDELVPEDEKVWLILIDSSVEPAKLWLFQGYIRPIQKVLSQLPKFSFYVIAKKYEWLLFNNQNDEFVALGNLKQQKVLVADKNEILPKSVENIAIRKVSINEISQLQRIARQTFSQTFSAENDEENMLKYLEEGFSLEKLTSELNYPNSEFHFADLGDKVIGYLKLNSGQSQTELKDANGLEIERIYVLKEFHGKKVGQLLYEKALQIAKQMNADYVWLGVWEENQRAINFYKKNGFVAFGKHIFKLGNEEQTDILMKLPLKDL